MKRKNIEPLPMDVLQQAASVLRVLAHPHRLKMVELLMGRQLTVGELAADLALAPHAVSQHLNQMKAHGIFHARRDGRSVYYNVISPHAITLLQCIAKHRPK